MAYHPSRRAVLAGAASTAVSVPARAQATLTPFKFGLANKSMSPTSAPFALPEQLGYFRQEGLTVEVVPLGSDAALAAAVDQERLDAMVGVPSFLLPLLARQHSSPFISYFEYTYPFKWAVAVKPGSPLRSLADLRDRTVGVSNLGTSDYAIGRKLLQMSGIDPDKGVSWLATGEGVAAGRALERGDVAALIYYDTGFGTIEGAGIRLDYLPLPSDVPKVGGLYIATKATALASRGDALAGFARAVAKADLFMQANPDAAAYILLSAFPEMAPVGRSLREKIASVAVPLRKRNPILSNYDPTVTELGAISQAEVAADLQFLGLSGQLSLDQAWRTYSNALIPDINRFDREAVRRQAAAYAVPAG